MSGSQILREMRANRRLSTVNIFTHVNQLKAQVVTADDLRPSNGTRSCVQTSAPKKENYNKVYKMGHCNCDTHTMTSLRHLCTQEDQIIISFWTNLLTSQSRLFSAKYICRTFFCCCCCCRRLFANRVRKKLDLHQNDKDCNKLRYPGICLLSC